MSLPNEWSLVSLEEIALPEKGSIRRGPFGGSIKKEFFVAEGYKVYEQKNAINSNFDIGKYFIDEKKYKELEGFKIQTDDLIISCAGTIGRVAIVPSNAKPGVINQALMRIRPNQSIIRSCYLKWFLQSPLAQHTIFGQVAGTALKNLKAISEIKKSKIPLPPLEQQDRIVSILDKADSIRKKRQEAIKLTEELLRSQFLEMFGDPVINPKGWEIKPLGEISNVTKLAGFEYTKYIQYQDTGEIIALRALNIKNGGLKLNNIKFITKKTSDFLVRSQLFKNDIVMTYIGVNIGDVAIIDEDRKYHLAPNVAKISPENNLNPTYLMRCLQFNKSQLDKYTVNTAKQSLNMSKIRKIVIPLPPLHLQKQFSNYVEKIQFLKIKNQNYYNESNNLFNSLLQKAFKGEL